MSTQSSKPRPPRKISHKEQQSVDEILKLVQDQTRKISLSGADYRTQKRIEHSPSQDDSDLMDDDYTTSSELSYSPPSTQESLFSNLSWDSSSINRQRRLSSGDSIGKVPRALPPLEPKTALSSPRPPARLASHESFDNDEQVKRPARPMSARGQRTLPRARGLTT